MDWKLGRSSGKQDHGFEKRMLFLETGSWIRKTDAVSGNRTRDLKTGCCSGKQDHVGTLDFLIRACRPASTSPDPTSLSFASILSAFLTRKSVATFCQYATHGLQRSSGSLLRNGSTSFASEQLHSVTTSLTKVLQSLR